ncbi:MAG: (2Fe-2S)-binding protein, partial [Campylobacterales bacterium]
MKQSAVCAAITLRWWRCNMGMITITIDGQSLQARPGETILQAARRAGIYIPTMCYLSKTAPIASCRLCIVEVEGVEGFILSCQAKATEGAVIRTTSLALEEKRRDIMALYAVNHPLECGVCDKSGACDLQNKVLEHEVTSQSFAARDQKRVIKNWGMIQYDPSLCILCEKCVHVCNEVIGDDAITLYFGGYKSEVITKKGGDLECTMCGECIAVCPVGALISTDFKYRSNAWELTKIPAACAHCAAGCQLYYEVKHDSIANNQPEIKRVTNEFEFSTLCGAGRFGFDFANRVEGKDPIRFQRALDALMRADTIAFSGYITNEEALLLQQMKQARGYRLVADDVRGFQKFLRAFRATSGWTIPTATLSTISSADAIIVFGTLLKSDNPMARYHLTMAKRRHNAQTINLHPVEEVELAHLFNQQVKYEVGSEEGVMALLLANILNNADLPSQLRSWIDDLDVGNLSGDASFDEREQSLMMAKLRRAKKPVLILGPDLYEHPRAENIARMAGLLQRFSPFKVVLIPPTTNALG